jgi:hypothetical protein
MPRQRKHWTHAAIRVALVLVVVDVFAYLAVKRPMASLLANEQQGFTAARIQWRLQQQALAAVQRRAEALAPSEQQVRAFVVEHLPRRREGFSRAATLITGLTRQSNVQLTGISYKLEAPPGEPFQVLVLSVYVQGPFASLLNFAHGLETATDLIVVRNFKFESGGEGMLGLRLTADLYLLP